MKKFFAGILFLLVGINAYPCDACGVASTGGYIGILPQFTRHFVGIRYHTWNFMGRISPHKRVQIILNAPLHYFTQVDGSVKRDLISPGDITALCMYQALRSPDSSVKKMRHSLLVGGGIKLPTGRYNIYDSNGYYDRNLQPGTGSWDFLVAAQYTIRWKGWGLNLEANGRINTLNPDNYLYGHKVSTQAKGFYWGKAKSFSFLATVGVGYDYSSRDVYMHQSVLNSGGHMLSGSTSFDFYLKRWVLGAEFRMPIYNQLSGGLLNPGPQLMSQVLFMF